MRIMIILALLMLIGVANAESINVSVDADAVRCLVAEERAKVGRDWPESRGLCVWIWCHPIVVKINTYDTFNFLYSQ
jgi:hypothetical protein